MKSHQSATRATLAGIADRLRPRRRTLRLRDTDRLDGRTCLITGANVGLGKAIACELGRRGADLVLAGRTLDESARAEVQEAAGPRLVEMTYLDLASLATVTAFVERQREQGRRFDVTVLNAGVVPRASRRTEDGFEEGFQVNYLANFALVRGLLEAGVIPNHVFAASPAPRVTDDEAPRLVLVSSESHRSAAPIDWRRFGAYRKYGMSRTVAEYGRTKLLLSMFGAELARRLGPEACGVPGPDVAVFSLCPGAVHTRIAREAPAWAKPLLWAVFTAFFRSPEKAAEPAVYLACARALEGRTGVYLHPMAEKPLAPHALDPFNGRRLWELSEQLLTDGPPDAVVE